MIRNKRLPYPSWLTLCAALALAVEIGPAAGADPYASPWSPGIKSAARFLVIGSESQDGSYRGGVEIRLDRNAITYWRTPGEAGAPPVLTDLGSSNLGAIHMLFPTPKVFNEAGSKAYGYDRHVIFPLRITAKDPGKPVILHLRLDYAACEKICIPARAEAMLPVPEGRDFGPYEDAVATFEAEVPMAQPLGADAPLTVTALRDFAADANGAKAHFTVVGRAPPNSGPVTLFAEAPTGWYLEPGAAKAGQDGSFVVPVTIAEMPKGAKIAATEFTFTVAAGNKAIEVKAHLDGAASAL